MSWRKGVALVVFASCVLFLPATTADAADARNYNAGRIIDDAVFTNSESMTVQQIQSFLNSKTTCDTYGRKNSELGGGTRAQWLASRGISVPITCLRDYYENPSNGANNYGKATPAGAISAAQIIYNYSRQFNINPQVIIVTLQKENGLITDEWPTPKQYSEAMGFGCPDNVAPGAPACDPSYGSFSAQIYQAARHFRGYIDNGPGWWVPFNTGNNAIRWSPSASCGSGTVNIQNRSTVALYSYTPYQPNQAALNAQYGTGNSCSAYGNRNFYLYFTDWFGTTVGTRDLLSDGNSIFYVSNGYKYYIPNMQEYYNYGYTDADAPRIIRVSTAELNKIPTAAGFSQVSVVAASQGQGIFIISNGYKYYVPSMAILYSYGFKDSDVMLISEESMNRYGNVNRSLGYFASDINGYAYRVESGERRVIYQPWVLSEYPDASTANMLSWSVLDKIKIGAPITKGRLAFYSGASKYIVSGGRWLKVENNDVYSCVGGVEGNIPVEPYRVALGTISGIIGSCFVSNEGGEKFLLDGSVKYALSDDNIQYSSVRGDDGVTDMPTISYVQHKNILATKDGIYHLENGTARHIMQMSYVNQTLGGNSVRVLNTDSLRTLPKGPNLYTDGTIIASLGRGINLIAGGKVYYIGSMDLFYAYGFKTANIISTSDTDIDRQAYGGTISSVRLRCGGSYYLLSNGTKYLIPEASVAIYGGASSFTDTSCPLIDHMEQGDMTRFVTSPNNSNIYYIDNGKRRHILSWQTFLGLGGETDKVIVLDKYTFETFPSGTSM